MNACSVLSSKAGTWRQVAGNLSSENREEMSEQEDALIQHIFHPQCHVRLSLRYSFFIFHSDWQ